MPPRQLLHPTLKSPLAPKTTVNLPPLAGVRLATGKAGIKYRDRTDVLMMVLAPGTHVAGVLTQSKTASAPVDWCRKHLAAGAARVLVVNSGNANAFTGKAGLDAVREVAESAAGVIGCRAQEVFVASTGVIGEPLPYQKITRILGQIAQSGAAGGWRSAAEAIMTTDTYPKLASTTAYIDGHRVTINGIAKGSGMIAPDMATMLAFVFTDANLPAAVLQPMLSEGDAALVQLHHRRQRHLDQRHAASVRDRQAARAHPAIAKPNDKRLDRLQGQAERRAARAGPASGEGRRGRHQADPGRRHRGCSPTSAAQENRARDRQFAAGENRDCRRRRQLGPRSSWRSARPVSRPIATS